MTLAAGALFVSSLLLARTITVDDDGPAEFRSIQAAIDAPGTVAGDVVSVAPGAYFEHLTLKRGVSVVGAGVSSTTINGGGAGAVVTIMGGDSATRLQGFTLTKGEVGVDSSFGRPIITLNQITGNGLGVSLFYDDALVVQNVISHNTAGGGIKATEGSPVITRNEIFGNRASQGAGIGLYSSGFYTSYSSPVVSNNLIKGNTATGSGGGIYAMWYCDTGWNPLIVNNTIVSNLAAVGGGLATRNTMIRGNIFYENSATGGGGAIRASGPCYAQDISFNIFFRNSPESCLVSGISCSGSDNLEADPLLINPAGGDHRLRPGSPAIDSSGGAPRDDLRGQARPLDGNSDGAAQPDRGAYEYDRDEVPGLQFSASSLLVWNSAIGASTYHVYSGGIDSLRRGGLDTCRDGDDSNRSDLAFTETRTPPVGSALAYVVTAVVGGAEGSPGFDSRGVERTLAVHCPACTSWSCPWCPVAEICDNGIDDDCDLLVDSDDPDCGGCSVAECTGDPCPPGYLCGFSGCCIPYCFDNVRDGDEGDVDCGGSCAAKCAPGQHCYGFYDCASGVCVNAICQ